MGGPPRNQNLLIPAPEKITLSRLSIHHHIFIPHTKISSPYQIYDFNFNFLLNVHICHTNCDFNQFSVFIEFYFYYKRMEKLKSFLVQFPSPVKNPPSTKFPVPIPLNVIWKTLVGGPVERFHHFNFALSLGFKENSRSARPVVCRTMHYWNLHVILKLATGVKSSSKKVGG